MAISLGTIGNMGILGSLAAVAPEAAGAFLIANTADQLLTGQSIGQQIHSFLVSPQQTPAVAPSTISSQVTVKKRSKHAKRISTRKRSRRNRSRR